MIRVGYKFDETRIQKPIGNSLTVPGQTYSVKEIIERFTRGEHLPIVKKVYYGDDISENYLYGVQGEDISVIQSYYEQAAVFSPPAQDPVKDPNPDFDSSGSDPEKS